MNYLLDDYIERGRGLKNFLLAARTIDSASVLEKIDFSTLNVWDYLGQNHGRYLFCCLETRITQTWKGRYGLLFDTASVGFSGLSDFEQAALQESLSRERVLFTRMAEKKYAYPVSKAFWKTFGARQRNLGGSFLRQSSHERNLALAIALDHDPEEAIIGQVLIRHNGSRLKKMFAIFAESHERFPFGRLGEAVRELQGTVEFWEITQECCKVYVELPEWSPQFPDLIPGFLFLTSDTGYVSTQVVSTWRPAGSPVTNYYIQDSIDFDLPSIEELSSAVKTLQGKQETFYNKYALFRSQIDAAYNSKVRDTLITAGKVGTRKRKIIERQMADKAGGKALDYCLALPEQDVLSDYQKEKYRYFLQRILERPA